MTVYRHMDNELAFFSQNLSKLRKLRGISQQQLANLALIPRSTIASLESGHANPTLSNSIKISKCLHISIDELINKPLNNIQLIKADEVKIKKKGNGYILYNLLPLPVEHIELEKIQLQHLALMSGTPHSKNTKEYFICLKGTATIIIEGEKFIIKKGNTLIFTGDSRHSYRNMHKETMHGISIIVRK